MLDGWGTPANVLAAREQFRLIQVEAMETGTAMLADEWVPVPPGTESAFAQGILDALKQGSPAGLAKELVENGPSVVLGRPSRNLRNQSTAGRVRHDHRRPRRRLRSPDSWTKSAAPITPLADVPDHSIRVLLIDESSAAELHSVAPDRTQAGA